MHKRKNITIRKEEILNAALDIAKRDGYHSITRAQVAIKAKCTEGLVSHYFGTMHSLKKYVIRHAVKNQILPIIAQGLANNDKHTKGLNDEVKQQALATL